MTKTTGFIIGFLLTLIIVGGYFYSKYKPANIVLNQLEITDLNNNKIDFESLKGKPLVVNFWATWCGTCIAEMPDFQRAQAELQGKVNFVYVSEEDTETIKNSLAQRNFSGNFYVSKTPFKTLGITSWPVTYFYDKNGKHTKTKLGKITYEELMK
jgi:thiol-disulfide isomerase/thioredoxin